MKKLTFKDLTPELLKELFPLATAAEIIEACKKKDLEISERGAEKLLEQFKKANDLSKEDLKGIAGGGYYGTQTSCSPNWCTFVGICTDDDYCYYDCAGYDS